MKRNVFSYLIFIGLIFALIYVVADLIQDDHPSLNDKAVDPDEHLKNVKKYAKDHSYERSLHHLNKAIETIRVIEADADIHAGEILETTIKDLENLKYEFETNTLHSEDLNESIGKALNALTYTELRVSESYAETNKLDKAKLAMKYGLLHLKNSMKFAKGPLRQKELEMYHEIDSMLKSESLYSVEATLKLDELVSELEEILTEE